MQLEVLNEILCIRSSSQSCCGVQIFSNFTDYFLVYLSYQLLREVLKSPIIIVNLSVSSCSSPIFALYFLRLCDQEPINLEVLYLHDDFTFFSQEVSLEVSFGWYSYSYIISYGASYSCTSFQFVFAQYNFFYFFTFILFVFLNQT